MSLSGVLADYGNNPRRLETCRKEGTDPDFTCATGAFGPGKSNLTLFHLGSLGIGMG